MTPWAVTWIWGSGRRREAMWWLSSSLKQFSPNLYLTWLPNIYQNCHLELVSSYPWQQSRCRGGWQQWGENWDRRWQSSQPVLIDVWISTKIQTAWFWTTMCNFTPAWQFSTRLCPWHFATKNICYWQWLAAAMIEKIKPGFWCELQVGLQLLGRCTGRRQSQPSWWWWWWRRWWRWWCLVVLSSVVVVSTSRALMPSKKTRSPPVRSCRHSNNKYSICTLGYFYCTENTLSS